MVMHRTLCSLLIALFLAAQMLSLLHLAAHGFEKHEHNGQTCEVCLHNEQTQYADAATPAVLPTLVLAEIRRCIFASVLLNKGILGGVSTRGPPAFLPI